MSDTPKTSEADDEALPSAAAKPETVNPKQSETARTGEAAADGPPSNTVKDPSDWTTGEESMTGAQASYLKTLSEEANEEFDPSLSKADASKRIDALQGKTGRGKNH